VTYVPRGSFGPEIQRDELGNPVDVPRKPPQDFGPPWDDWEPPDDEPPPPDDEPSEPQAPDRIRFLTRNELSQLRPPTPLIDGILDEHTVGILVGKSGVGKSFLSLDFALSVATGTPWQGRSVKQHPVLFVVGEGTGGLDRRVTAWERAHTPITGDQLLVCPSPPLLADWAAWAALRERAKGAGRRFVILDTYSSLIAMEENSAKETSKVLRELVNFRDTIDGTVLLIHHAGWSDGERARGSSAFEANTDTVLTLAGREGILSLSLKKAKEDEGGTVLHLKLEQVTLPTGLTSCVVTSLSASAAGATWSERIHAHLDAVGDIGCTGTDLLRALQVTDTEKSAFYKGLNQLRTSGDVRDEGSRGRQRYWLIDHHPTGDGP
jgi:AAA domain